MAILPESNPFILDAINPNFETIFESIFFFLRANQLSVGCNCI